MKYSIRGTMHMTEGTQIVDTLNMYTLWKLVTNQAINETGTDVFIFEVWVNTIEDKDRLFEDLKPFVDQYGESIDWHECTHDESVSQPCVIAETYTRG